jgi:CelD/BcsL family acetyltransferase involved in cellulose biosynthesis
MLASNRPRAEMLPIEDAEAIRDEWIDLAQRATEPNPFYEIDYLVSVCRHMLPGEEHRLVLIRDAESRRLDGLFPVTVRGLREGYPGGVADLSFDSLIGHTVPLIAGAEPAAVWRAFLDFVDEQPELPSIVHLKEFYSNGPCGAALAAAADAGHVVRRAESAFERAIATPGLTFDEYVARWSGNRGRKIRNGNRKLSELGTVQLAVVEQDDAAFDAVLEEVLALERSGWKGREETALASQQHTLDFARSAFGAGRATPQISLATLRLDGRLIAGCIAVVARGRYHGIKTAYDEALSQYSPGTLLLAFMLEDMLKSERCVRLDSCSDPGHPVEKVWLERERVERVFVAAAGRANERSIDRLISRRAALSAARNAARGVVRRLRRTA